VRAGWWLVIGVAVAGVLIISLVTWLVATAGSVSAAAGGGPRRLLAKLVENASYVVYVALLARVILSWMGIGRYTKWMRPAYWLTDWLVEPIRRILPPLGSLDWSPLVAVVALWLTTTLLLWLL
jgi:YggT family protein